jgi:GNAT superfamily N-acetyltransferase
VVELSTDPGRLDLDLLHRWLSEQAYWAKGRSRSAVRAAVEGSWCVGAYDGPVQVGFARLVSDRSTHAWLCDVFVDADRRGEGIGKLLVRRCVQAADAWGVGRTMLATRDAHGLYRAFGFTDVDGGLFLERRP